MWPSFLHDLHGAVHRRILWLVALQLLHLLPCELPCPSLSWIKVFKPPFLLEESSTELLYLLFRGLPLDLTMCGLRILFDSLIVISFVSSYNSSKIWLKTSKTSDLRFSVAIWAILRPSPNKLLYKCRVLIFVLMSSIKYASFLSSSKIDDSFVYEDCPFTSIYSYSWQAFKLLQILELLNWSSLTSNLNHRFLIKEILNCAWLLRIITWKKWRHTNPRFRIIKQVQMWPLSCRRITKCGDEFGLWVR